jgi:predicted SAM-dependent methyltransferase/tetratricopeptide (TPR) repeat protein
MTLLHLGCGLDYRPGAVNVDRHTLAAADLQADALRLPLAARSVARIEARHLVEHLGYAGTIYALAEWWRVLEPQGTLLVETPDRTAACRAAAEPDAPAQALHWVFGLPWPGYQHRTLFDGEELGDLAERTGFEGVEIARPDAPQPTLRLIARKAGTRLAGLRARLHAGFVAAGIVEPLSAPPHLAHLETICDRVIAAAEALPREGATACLAAALGATARYDPRVTEVAVQVLVAQGFVPEGEAEPFLDLAHSLVDGAFPARLATYLRRNPAPPGTQAHRLRRLADQASLYLTARLHPGEPALQPARQAFEAAATPVSAATRAGESRVFCGEMVAGLAREETVRGVRAFARNELGVAREHLEAAVAYDADNPLPVWNLARLALAEGQRLEALAWYAALLELLPGAADALRAEMDAVTGRAPRAGGPGPARWEFTGPVGGESVA